MQRVRAFRIQINPLAKYLVLCLFGSLLIFFVPQKTLAQSKSNITVSPQLIQLDLSKDSPEAEYTYTNNTNQTIELTLSMQDVRELEDRGIPGILDPNQTQNYKYGLSSWARFSNQNLVITPGESKTVTVFIDKSRLTLGGHYATVLAELQQRDEQKSVKLRAIISTLLFVRSGSEYEQEVANIVGIDTNTSLFQFPNSITFRLQNSGNVDVTPYGLITVVNPLEKEVARGIVNENSLITLPDSTRKYVVKLKKDSPALLPGLYKAKVDIHYGKNKFSTQKETTFLVLSVINVYILGAIILIGAAFIIVHRKLKKK